MTARAFFKITASVAIADNPPGHIVHLEIDEDGAPLAIYWRRRLADGDIAPHSIDSSASESKSPSPKPKKGA